MRSLIAPVVVVAPQIAAADCICLNQGAEIPEGQTACIKTNSGKRLAVCEKNLNVTNWKFLQEGYTGGGGGTGCQLGSSSHCARLNARLRK